MSKAVPITVSQRQRAILERWQKNRAGTSAQLIERSSIILLSAEGVSNTEQGQLLGIDRQRVRRWRTRWSEAQERLAEAEQHEASDKDLARLLGALLTDEQRSGVPPTFTAEQLTQILAVACESPCDSGRPVTHWSPRELVDEVIKRGIVQTISARHVSRLLKRGLFDPTRRGTG